MRKRKLSSSAKASWLNKICKKVFHSLIVWWKHTLLRELALCNTLKKASLLKWQQNHFSLKRNILFSSRRQVAPQLRRSLAGRYLRKCATKVRKWKWEISYKFSSKAKKVKVKYIWGNLAKKKWKWEGEGVISDIEPHHVTTIWLVLGVLGDQISIELADWKRLEAGFQFYCQRSRGAFFLP